MSQYGSVKAKTLGQSQVFERTAKYEKDAKRRKKSLTELY